MSVVSVASPPRENWVKAIVSRAQADTPAITDWVAAVGTAVLLILSFPNFDLALLAWIGLVPLLVAIARRPSPVRALILGWTAGTIFFYGSCYWLTYSMTHYGGLPAIIAYVLLIPGAILVGFFPGLFSLILALVIRRWGLKALLLSPFIWAACEYARLGVTGQLWNAIGYSQAFHPWLIQSARVGGVYAVGFLIVMVNAAIVFALIGRTGRSLALGGLIVVAAVAIIPGLGTDVLVIGNDTSGSHYDLSIVALQPNVPMTLVKTNEEMEQLLVRHLDMSRRALSTEAAGAKHRLLVWPESPMNFTYASDRRFQEVVTKFAVDNQTSILFNSQEPAPGGGTYNSAVLINEKGLVISQYDKIRLLPFGEYVPLPRWLPGASLITAIVGDFTPGANYTLMPVASHRAGVFICIESAYPSIARSMANAGADVLINISNDGYLGPTAVMRQHLANAVFRAVENDRPVVRVTNSGITALIDRNGRVNDQTKGFEPDIRVWQMEEGFVTPRPFYTRYGDVFPTVCLVLTVLVTMTAFWTKRRDLRA